MSKGIPQDRLILDINRINALSPYYVTYDDGKRAFVFTTDHGINCYVSFSPDEGVLEDIENVYNLLLATYPRKVFKKDHSIEKTIVAIITEFFKDRNRVLGYFCDHSVSFDNRHPTDIPYPDFKMSAFQYMVLP
ncbi:MAG: hypothetical protein LUF87_09640 [Alistipes sp.]|nr:hypothetical protein [Alistipes sp.]